jgi:uncharacterized membrane protein YkvA (DUF1232 family)|tara:strand:+ start:233 stop:496 length:264 start_codon:yes stop_codon:yes gene_type:complete
MKNHNHKIKSLKIRIYKVEKLIDKMSRRTKRQAKDLIRSWVDWWAIRKEKIMLKNKWIWAGVIAVVVLVVVWQTGIFAPTDIPAVGE